MIPAEEDDLMATCYRCGVEKPIREMWGINWKDDTPESHSCDDCRNKVLRAYEVAYGESA